MNISKSNYLHAGIGISDFMTQNDWVTSYLRSMFCFFLEHKLRYLLHHVVCVSVFNISSLIVLKYIKCNVWMY